jgi:hypothetical protein
MFALAFAIGMFVALSIWILYSTMNAKAIQRFKRRETYNEIKQLKNKKIN